MARSTKKEATQTRYRVHIPGYSGTHPLGIKFTDNDGYTDDPAVAKSAAEDFGFEVSEEKSPAPAEATE